MKIKYYNGHAFNKNVLGVVASGSNLYLRVNAQNVFA